MQELQELNQRQTAIIRDLSAQQENAAAEMRADLEVEKIRLNKKVELDIAYSRKQRKEQEVGSRLFHLYYLLFPWRPELRLRSIFI